MENSETSPDQVARTVFCIIMLGVAAFVTGVLLLIR